jgi:hypothetical protein
VHQDGRQRHNYYYAALFMYSYSGAPNTAKEQNTAGRVTFETGLSKDVSKVLIYTFEHAKTAVSKRPE